MDALSFPLCGRLRPFWISPRQLCIVPVSQENIPYGERVRQRMHEAGFEVVLENSRKTLNKKVRESQLAQYNFILVVGAEEERDGSVNVRARDNTRVGTKSLDDAIAWFKELQATYQ